MMEPYKRKQVERVADLVTELAERFRQAQISEPGRMGGPETDRAWTALREVIDRWTLRGNE